ncbi:MAG: helix-turn-helix domain-containing protein [Pirellulaceae bacterium]
MRDVRHQRGTAPQFQQEPAVLPARMLAMWLARRMTRAALSEIGDYFGGRRHSTVATAQRTVDGWLKNDRVVGTMHRSLQAD